MKFACLLALLGLFPSLAQADIYKAVDADGHVTYSSAPIKGGKRVVLTPLPASTPHVRSRASPQDFPKVSQETQKGRDDTRRKILEDELRLEAGLLNEATQSESEASRKVAKDDEKIKALSKQVELHQRNINALKIELSKLK
ncbi:MAG: hypothetical protein A3K00_08125 [Gallionellales bacterium RIFOXYD2_FULL_52_7]|nr:MAG: hypothetical protein A3K00_08125 [Gallionellales bacterium RIFOXYD2_FULL_52_7]